MSAPILQQLQQDIETRLASDEPGVELLLCELNGGTVRIFIDHPEGVDLALCERVTRALRGLREKYGLEVSSPGPKRPLTKPDHFRRFIGRRAKVRTRSDHEGRRSFTGELIAADDAGITIGADGSLVSIAYDDISKSNLVPDAAPAGAPPKGGKRQASDRHGAVTDKTEKTESKTE
jgi:ribosome maturation factor RimP